MDYVIVSAGEATASAEGEAVIDVFSKVIMAILQHDRVLAGLSFLLNAQWSEISRHGNGGMMSHLRFTLAPFLLAVG